MLAPCIMCVQYRGGYSVPWGCSVPWGDILSTVEGYLEYRGVFSTVGDTMINVGDILSTVGCSVPWGISWVLWGVQYRGGISWCTWGYHEYRGGCSVPWGYHPLKFEYRGGISWYMWGISWVPWGTQITKDFSPHGTEHPPWYSWYPPRASWYPPRYWTPPTVLKITTTVQMLTLHGTGHPHGTQDIPHIYHDIPTVLNTPTVLKISPHGTHDIPHDTHDIPHGTEHPPWYWAPPHGTAHTLYRVVRRIADFDLIIDQLETGCRKCKVSPLKITNADLSYTLHPNRTRVVSENCQTQNSLIIHSWEVEERLVLSCLHTGIGHSHLEALLNITGLPCMAEGYFQRCGKKRWPYS